MYSRSFKILVCLSAFFFSGGQTAWAQKIPGFQLDSTIFFAPPQLQVKPRPGIEMFEKSLSNQSFLSNPHQKPGHNNINNFSDVMPTHFPDNIPTIPQMPISDETNYHLMVVPEPKVDKPNLSDF